eukprot:4615141-Alexandrium_andersonii.AAC.1
MFQSPAVSSPSSSRLGRAADKPYSIASAREGALGGIRPLTKDPDAPEFKYQPALTHRHGAHRRFKNQGPTSEIADRSQISPIA